MLYFVLFIIITLFAIKKYNIALLSYAGFRLFFHSGIALHYTPPLLPLDFACCCVFFSVACVKRRIPKVEGCLKNGIGALFVSYLLAVFSSYYPFASAWPPMFGKAMGICFAILFLHELKNLHSVKVFVTSYGVTMMLFLLYGFIEFVLQSNPVIAFERTMFPEEMKNMIYLSEQIRLGSVRCQSFAAISISFGALCSFWIAFVFILWKCHTEIFRSKIILILLCLLSVFCSLSTGSKSPFIFLVSFIYVFVLMYKGMLWKKVFIMVASLLFLLIGSEYISDFIMQIADSKKSSTEGSDIPMRIKQFSAIVDALDGNFLFGLGAKGVMRAQQIKPAVLGAESIWFQLILEQGIIGIGAYLFCLKKIIKFAKNSIAGAEYKYVKIFIISWLCINTVSSLPGIDLVNLFCIVFAIVRYYQIKKQSECIGVL